MDLEAPLLSHAPPSASKKEDLEGLQEKLSRKRCFIGWGWLLCIAFLCLRTGYDEGLSAIMATIDYTLRPTADTSYCIASDTSERGSLVGLKLCDSVGPDLRQFDLWDNGTIHLTSEPSLCVAVSQSGTFQLDKCSGTLEQLWIFQVSGNFELQSQKGQCMNVLRDDFAGGQLGLYQCERKVNTIFAYGGGHFLFPDLMDDMDYMSNYVKETAVWNVSEAALWSFLIFFLIAAVCKWDASPKFSFTCCDAILVVYIFCLACIQSYSLLEATYQDIVHHTQIPFHIHLDYSLKMSLFPGHCISASKAAPSSVVSMKPCISDDDMQQFILQAKPGKRTIHLRSRPDLCISKENDIVILDNCTDASSNHEFSTPKGSGGSLPLVHTASCLNLLFGDIGSGALGFYECGGSMNQVFVYDNGNPTVARILHQIRSLYGRSRVLRRMWPLRFTQMQHVGLSACFLAFYLLLKFAGLVVNTRASPKMVIPESIRSGFRSNKTVSVISHKWETPLTRLKRAMEMARNAKPLTADTIAKLEIQITTARSEGVKDEIIEKATALYSDLKARVFDVAIVAAEELVEAVHSKNLQDIAPCLEACRCLGAGHAIADNLPTIAPLLKTQMDLAARMSRTERRDMLPAMEQILGILREFSYPDAGTLLSRMIDFKGSLRVLCRVRPPNKWEIETENPAAVARHNNFSVSVTVPRKSAVSEITTSEIFSYDALFLETSTQAEVFQECKDLVQSAFDGYNVSIFSYGQTGAGKTYTLYGVPEQPGIAPRTCEEVFSLIGKAIDKFDVSVKASMIELYNDDLRDLLSSQKLPPKIDINMSKTDAGLEDVRLDYTEIEVDTTVALNKVVDQGLRQRKVACTIMNATSSRSHMMFIIHLRITDKASGAERTGKITIVDLGGSERISKNLNDVVGDVKKEAIKINSSLSALCDVMSALTSGSDFVPYRNHKLTMLMQDSLGGSAKTLMFVNISPCRCNADETINALRYASRARSIENDVAKKERAKRGSAPSNSCSPRSSPTPATRELASRQDTYSNSPIGSPTRKLDSRQDTYSNAPRSSPTRKLDSQQDTYSNAPRSSPTRKLDSQQDSPTSSLRQITRQISPKSTGSYRKQFTR